MTLEFEWFFRLSFSSKIRTLTLELPFISLKNNIFFSSYMNTKSNLWLNNDPKKNKIFWSFDTETAIIVWLSCIFHNNDNCNKNRIKHDTQWGWLSNKNRKLFLYISFHFLAYIHTYMYYYFLSSLNRFSSKRIQE